ncbi:MAG: hypothetical protein KAR20_28200 [Candidatus Heimdallarchaeota archaeon]|nr:hypothetical protein [Candidatus Heimdallarchaeota archaeon]
MNEKLLKKLAEMDRGLLNRYAGENDLAMVAESMLDLIRRISQLENRMVELEGITPEFPQFGSTENYTDAFDKIAEDIFHVIESTISQAIDSGYYPQKIRDQMYDEILNKVGGMIDTSPHS